MSDTKKISAFLTGHSSLKDIQRIQRIQAILNDVLSPELVQQVRVSRLRNQSLVIVVSNPGTASRLRYMQREILTHVAQRASLHCSRLEVKVLPANSAVPAAVKKTHTLSAQSAALLKQTANQIEDPQLSDAMRRLSGASTIKNRSN